MKVKFKMDFQVDKSIAKGIKVLNRNEFFTTSCCSGIPKDHNGNLAKDRLFVDFVELDNSKLSYLTSIAREVGFIEI